MHSIGRNQEDLTLERINILTDFFRGGSGFRNLGSQFFQQGFKMVEHVFGGGCFEREFQRSIGSECAPRCDETNRASFPGSTPAF